MGLISRDEASLSHKNNSQGPCVYPYQQGAIYHTLAARWSFATMIKNVISTQSISQSNKHLLSKFLLQLFELYQVNYLFGKITIFLRKRFSKVDAIEDSLSLLNGNRTLVILKDKLLWFIIIIIIIITFVGRKRKRRRMRPKRKKEERKMSFIFAQN